MMIRMREPGTDNAQLANQLRGIFNRVHPVRRIRRVARGTAHFAAHRQLTLVTQHRFQLRRLADQAQFGLEWTLLQLGEHRPDTQAADFFIVGKGQVHRAQKRTLHEGRHRREHRGNEPFHVRRATPVQAPFLFRQPERIDRPGLPVNRYHISVAREHDATGFERADGREQIGLGAFFVEEQLTLHTMPGQIRLDETDQFQVGIAADSGEANQAFQQVATGRLTHRPALRSSAPSSG
ncbi:hypothetical protein D3C84_642160 [compost metagenome]